MAYTYEDLSKCSFCGKSNKPSGFTKVPTELINLSDSENSHVNRGHKMKSRKHALCEKCYASITETK